MTTSTAAAPRIDWRIAILGLLIAALCAVFWLDSRYPSLQGKASADPDEALATPLGFEQHFPEPGAHEPVRHVLWSAAEWAITNKQGMTFGLLLAAGLLTLVPLLPPARGGRVLGALQGALAGAPLGVCINCAAPIGQAMLKAGSRVEVALATMFASPSFNVIVLGILLSLFPAYLVALKLASSLAMVLIGVPLLSRLAERPGWRKPAIAPAPSLPGLRLFQWLQASLLRAQAALRPAGSAAPRGPGGALKWVALEYPRNLWTVVRLALPLMLLAGLVGAAMAELLPWGRLAQIAQVEGFWQNLAVLALVAAFGTALPVPMAFDIIVCAVLWDAGVPPHLVAALLVTLGIYSVYPFSLLGTTLSWRLAAAAGALVFALGCLAGGAASLLHGWHELRLARDVAGILDTTPAPADVAPVLPRGRDAAELRDAVLPAPEWDTLLRQGGLELQRAAFMDAPQSASGGFTRLDGAQLGFERLPLPRPYTIMEPAVMHLGPLAAGDVNDDGWPDVAVGTPHGAMLYVNLGGRFAQQAIHAAQGTRITALALQDLGGDGAPELVACAWMSGCRIFTNREGRFPAESAVDLPRGSETSVQSLAFADVDRDGDVDLVTGATSYVPRFFYPAGSVNRLWRNDGAGGFAPEALAGPEGETLSLLFVDLDGDGWEDLIVGNDFDEPDRVYRNERGRLQPLPRAQAPLGRTTWDTMSIDAGDIDNDGREDLYFGGIAMGSPGAGFARRVAQPLPSCQGYAEVADRVRCDAVARFQLATFAGYGTQSMQPCRELADPVARRDCAVSAYHWNRVLARLPVLGADKARVLEECDAVPADFATMRDICAAIAASDMDHERSDETFADELPQLRQTNLLYRAGEAGFGDVTGHWKAGLGGWTWNARFADLDNDGWQDLFITQGTRLRPASPSSVWYRNRAGQGFEDLARTHGLADHNPTGAALFIDYDLDGDLDLLTQPFLLTPVMFRNDTPDRRALMIGLDDRLRPNRAALGARVTVQDGERRQLRVLRASGGYQSANAPVAAIGLGASEGGDALRVTWPDGSESAIETTLPPGRYRLIRRTGP